MKKKDWAGLLFDDSVSFNERCSKAFSFQKKRNQIYGLFLSALGYNDSEPSGPQEIPLMPIRAFRQAIITVDNASPQLVFKSSGTAGMNRSSHFIHDVKMYTRAISLEFYNHFPGDKYALLCYMPGYSENPDSSLIWMANYLVSGDESGLSIFWDPEKVSAAEWENRVIKAGKIPLIFGAAFGLLDLIEQHETHFTGPVEIIETGGMKTYRREMSKKQLRQRLSEGFSIPQHSVHSEYGMCELLSQMYAIGNEWFSAPQWAQVTIRDPEDPKRICSPGEEGKIGIIDLANIYSCPFILTDDMGVADVYGRFRVLGRWHDNDPRGCNFLIDRD